MKPKSADLFLKNIPKELRIVLFFGPDEGQVREHGKKLAQAIVEDLHAPFNVAEITASSLNDDPARLHDEMSAQSLMGGRRLVRIRDGADSIHTALKNLLDNMPSGDSFLVIEAGELPSTSKIRKLLEPAGVTNAAAIACYQPDTKDLSRLAEEMFKEANIRISRDALDLFSSLVANDRAMARGEIDKLILYAGKEQSLGYEDVAAALGDSAILNMDAPAWAAGSGNLQELDRSLERLFADGLSPVPILRSTQRHFLRLYEVTSSKQPVDVAMKSLRPPVFWKDVSRFRQQASAWRGKKLEDALTRLIAAEADCKKTGVRDTTLCARTLMSIAGMARRR